MQTRANTDLHSASSNFSTKSTTTCSTGLSLPPCRTTPSTNLHRHSYKPSANGSINSATTSKPWITNSLEEDWDYWEDKTASSAEYSTSLTTTAMDALQSITISTTWVSFSKEVTWKSLDLDGWSWLRIRETCS